MTAKKLLPKVKANLILQHDEDDELLLGFISSAIDYAENYQNQSYKSYQINKSNNGNNAANNRTNKMSPTTQQAVIMLATHFYESRDGGTGGFFTSNTYAVTQIWNTVNRLLALNKRWET